MKILGLDFETTGLNSQTDRVIEIGAVVWDCQQHKPQALMSEIIRPEPFESLSPEIVEITGLDDQTLKDYGVDGEAAFQRLKVLIDSCDYIMAHNAPFDRSFFQEEMKYYGVDIDHKQLHWIDTCIDIPYPTSIQTRKLTYLAAEHGIVNTYAHRAVFDVLTMLNVFKHYDVNTVVERSKSPQVSAIAQVTYDEREKAKSMGFHWNPKKKVWFKEMKECDLQSTQFPFEIILNSSEASVF